MRRGSNPEKLKENTLKKYYHRIIVIIHIPNQEEDYYKDQLPVLQKCLDGLFATINRSISVVTIIDNNSCQEVKNLLDLYQDKIEKLVRLRENLGKVAPILNEVRGIFEPFVTLMDSDVLLFEGWEKAVINIFQKYKYAGIVAPLPCPNLAFYNNSAVFVKNFLFGKLGYDKVVDDKDCKLYLKGFNSDYLLNRANRQYDWKEKSYFFKNDPSVIIGAGHFVATYRTKLFHKYNNQPEYKFKGGYEDEFLDKISDKQGFYRLSTVKTYAYHMGNVLDNFITNTLSRSNDDHVDVEVLKQASSFSVKNNFHPYKLVDFLFRVVKKVYKL
ncbi:glycosyltransferase family 2 protein [Leeuwenhoekiella sp. NPDC079379]|uniref:glycosyltransferase family 2 protein n=1 Tax=Leeuwenhoekiella sp. NPDC079379 TaxID=3364122 RepID=UPI0037CB735A